MRAGSPIPQLSSSVAQVWRLCRMRHSRHYAASRTMPRGSNRSRPRPAECGGGWHTEGAGVGIVRRLAAELFEEVQQLVVRLIAFGGALYGVGLCQGLFLQCEVG